MKLEQTLEMYRPTISQERQTTYLSVRDLESLSAGALYTGPLGDSLGFGSIEPGPAYGQKREVGESSFQVWLTDPQPEPELKVSTPDSFEMLSVQLPRVTSPSSIEYVNSKGLPLGGLTSLTPSETELLIRKYLSDKD